MKKLIYLACISFFLQSCFSYKAIGLNNKEMKSKVKITTINKTKIIGKVTLNNENEIVLISSKKSITVPKSAIETVEIKKFSILKTLGLGATGFITIILMAATR